MSNKNIPQRYDFPYVRFHGRYYPLIPLTLKKGKHSVNTFALLDSGASISVFRPEIARALHLSHPKRGSVRLGTAAGGVHIAISKVDVKINWTRFKMKVGFSQKYAANFNIIGREGFFSKFSICFNEIMKTVIMVPLDKLAK